MNFGLSFSYIFDDQDWFKKMLLPALCLLIPVVGWMVTVGWALKVTRNVIDGVEKPLPDIDFGNDILRGFFAFLISFVYSLPVTLITSIGGWVDGWHMFNNDMAMWGYGIFAGAFGLVAFATGLVTSFLSLGAVANYIAKDDFGAAFRLAEVWKLLMNNIGDWVIVALGTVLAVGIIGPLGTVACVIGVILTLTFGVAVMGHLMGQAVVRSQPPVQVVEENVE
ncbi:DUF4013 domain-containing protein (plasmid) [Chloroflexota bacterium]|nr:DUF4013 domain-containing protein [Chloroflexota bacterium]